MADRPSSTGCSLWLVPPGDSDLYRAILFLITRGVPSVYPGATVPRFVPHITLTADTVSVSQPQQWLDGITLPDSTSRLTVAILEANPGNIFFQKLTMRCEKTPELCDLASACRGAATLDVGRARSWIQENYQPHCSLMYSDLPQEEVQSKLDEVNKKIREVKRSYPDCTAAKGAAIWLVPTHKGIDEWQPIAVRHLPNVQWNATSDL